MDIETDDDRTRIDVDVVWTFLSEQAYWGRWRERSQVEQQLAGAWRLVGAYADGRMVGFARAISDGVSLAYLADVFVVESARGHGIGKALVRTMIDDGPGAEFRWMLHTADAHGMYKPFGFRTPDDTYLERPGKVARLRQARPPSPGPVRQHHHQPGTEGETTASHVASGETPVTEPWGEVTPLPGVAGVDQSLGEGVAL